LGLPWVSTLAAARTALQSSQKVLEVQTQQKERAKSAKKGRVEAITAELKAKREQLARLPSDKETRELLVELEGQFVVVKKQEHALIGRCDQATKALEQAQDTLQEDRRDLQTHIDSMAAGAVFRLLDPSFCPRCDHSVTGARREKERKTNACSVCGEA